MLQAYQPLFGQERVFQRVALPLRWLTAFMEKSQPQSTDPCKEWEAAVALLVWLK